MKSNDHDVEGIEFLVKNVLDLESILNNNSNSDYTELKLTKYKSYRFVAYPGNNMVKVGRAEHEPLHFHIFYDSNEIRIKTESFDEYDGKDIPRDLVKLFSYKAIRKYLRIQTEQVYKTGRKFKYIIPPKKLK